MDLQIAGKTALVTAGSKGLGKATAIALAAEGVNVTICARGEAALQAAAEEIRSSGGSVHSIVADVTEPEVPSRLVTETVGRFGSLDILVANAGGPPAVRALEVNEDSIAAAVNANLTTSIRLVQAAVPHMRSQHWGRICLITSRSIIEPIPSNALSNLARSGLWAWAKTAAQDLFVDGITLNTACPGLHETDRMKELGGAPDGTIVGDPKDFGNVVAFLCSEHAKFISGTPLAIAGA